LLLLIDNRGRWEPPPAPAPAPRRARLTRPGTGALKLLLAALLAVAGLVASGVASIVLLLLALVMVCSAAGTAMPYGLGLREHQQ
jgi:hypothetical protein